MQDIYCYPCRDFLLGLHQMAFLQSTCLQIRFLSYRSAKTVIEKSAMWKSEVWSPLLQNWAIHQAGFYELLLTKTPADLILKFPYKSLPDWMKRKFPRPPWSHRFHLRYDRLDQTIKTLAETLGLKRKTGKFPRYGKPFPTRSVEKGKPFTRSAIFPKSKPRIRRPTKCTWISFSILFPENQTWKRCPQP